MVYKSGLVLGITCGVRESECLVLASSQAACDFFGLEFLRVRCCLSLYSRSSSACIITAVMSPFQVVALSSGEKIYIPFCPLVQITDCLDFPKPTYFVVDAVKCYSCVYIRTEGAHGIFWFNGGEAATIDKSKEIAALRAINFLIKKYGVCVGDFTMDRMRMYEKCGKLYRLKRNSMESGDKRKCCGNKVAGAVVHVALDYVGFMPRVIRKTGVLVISIETVYSAGLGRGGGRIARMPRQLRAERLANNTDTVAYDIQLEAPVRRSASRTRMHSQLQHQALNNIDESEASTESHLVPNPVVIPQYGERKSIRRRTIEAMSDLEPVRCLGLTFFSTFPRTRETISISIAKRRTSLSLQSSLLQFAIASTSPLRSTVEACVAAPPTRQPPPCVRRCSSVPHQSASHHSTTSANRQFGSHFTSCVRRLRAAYAGTPSSSDLRASAVFASSNPSMVCLANPNSKFPI
uniref:Uncharacterized protein n=1 Tax=Chenopodium quinoa TaxID=63459 RepID=A0A803MQK6_CHEQI